MRQLAGVGILQRWVETGDQVAAAGKRILGAMGKFEARFALTLTRPRQVLQEAVEGDAAEADNDAQIA
jgi:hypothetical protein